MTATLRTDVGKARRQNEDAAFMDEERGVFAVADGMGGLSDGDQMSQAAVTAMMEGFSDEEQAQLAGYFSRMCDNLRTITKHYKEVSPF